MRKLIIGLFALVFVLFGTTPVLAEGYGWNYNTHPFDFTFGNHIDTHQQSEVNGKHLTGFFYIRFTEDQTAEGYPAATHANCNTIPEECTVGWILQGIPMEATYLGHEAGQHPQWYIAAENLPKQQGYSHFHWMNESDHADGLTVGQVYDGYLLKLTAREMFFFNHHGGFLVKPGIDVVTHANILTELP